MTLENHQDNKILSVNGLVEMLVEGSYVIDVCVKLPKIAKKML
jgi:hypothetical protein